VCLLLDAAALILPHDGATVGAVSDCTVFVALEDLDDGAAPAVLAPQGMPFSTYLQAGDCLVVSGAASLDIPPEVRPPPTASGLPRSAVEERSPCKRFAAQAMPPRSCTVLYSGLSVGNGASADAVLSASAEAHGEVAWVDQLMGKRGVTPTTVVQWSKGVAPPGQNWYT
jgi:hypothetical protein